MNMDESQIRLPKKDIDTIKTLFQKYFLSDDKLWIFGSRANSSKKGGDIDLYVETGLMLEIDAMKIKGDFLWDLEQEIGEQKIDLVLNMTRDEYCAPIYDIAKNNGIRII